MILSAYLLVMFVTMIPYPFADGQLKTLRTSEVIDSFNLLFVL